MSPLRNWKKRSKRMMNSPRIEKSWKLIDHTADLRVEVCGTDLQELFVNAAAALTEILGAGPDLAAEKDLDVLLESGSIDELMVDWLREILFSNQVRGWILVQSTIEELSGTTLKARLSCRVRPDGEQPDIEIKAVTYHGLSVQKTDQGYCAKILFDI